MTTFPAVTKEQIHEMNAEFSSICTDEKSKSSSPFRSRKIYIAPRRRPNSLQANDDDNHAGSHFHDFSEHNVNVDEKFQQMTDEQYKQYQHETMPQRMKRKRNFDALSSQSDSSLHGVLQSANTFRVPNHCLFYVRVNQNTDMDGTANINASPQSSSCSSSTQQTQPQTQTANAFELLINGSKSMRDWKSAAAHLQLNTDPISHDEQKGGATDEHGYSAMTMMMTNQAEEEEEDAMMTGGNVDGPFVVYPISEECSITRSVRVSSEWVQAYTRYDDANDVAWKQSNAHGKIHEYQVNRSHGIILVNLDQSRCLKGAEQRMRFWSEYEQNVKQWALDHSYSGLIVNGCCHLYQPHLYWNLLDDDKQGKVKQTLISDMFQSAKTKTTKSPWKCTFEQK